MRQEVESKGFFGFWCLIASEENLAKYHQKNAKKFG